MKTLLIMAGGTGGHVMPALAVADNLRDRGVRIVWMGTRQGIEYDLVPKAGFELKLLKVKGVRGSGLVRKLVAPWLLIRAAVQSISIVLSSKANAILGMGGFVSGPGGVVGRLLRKPLVLHEQNAIAGTTNKLLAPFARRILTGFNAVSALPRGEHIGNPVKPEIVELAAPAERLSGRAGELNVLIVGGSQGARVFNEELPALLNQLQSELAGSVTLKVRHQCGKDQQAEVSKRYAEVFASADAVKVETFIADMAAAYHWSDIVICRSGAMTVSEISAAGAVALFVPFPYAIDDHQYFNAQSLSKTGAAISLRQTNFVEGEWIGEVADLAKDRVRLIEMAEKARSFARPNATQDLADICMEVMNA